MGKIQRERAAARNLKPTTKQALAEKLGEDNTPLKPLSPTLVVLCYIGAVIATVSCLTGIMGIAVLLGEGGGDRAAEALAHPGLAPSGLPASAWASMSHVGRGYRLHHITSPAFTE